MGMGSEISDRERLVQPTERPVQGCTERNLASFRDGMGNELRLAAVAVWRNDEAPSHLIGNSGSVVTTDEVQAGVDARRASR